MLDQTTFPFNLSSFTYLYNNTIRLVINLILHIIQNQTVIFKNFIFLTSIGSYWLEIELQLGHGCHVENVRRELSVQHDRSATPHSATQRLAMLNAPLKDQPAWVTDVLMAGDDDYDVLQAIQ